MTSYYPSGLAVATHRYWVTLPYDLADPCDGCGRPHEPRTDVVAVAVHRRGFFDTPDLDAMLCLPCLDALIAELQALTP